MSASVVPAKEIGSELDGRRRFVCTLPDGAVAEITLDVIERIEREAVEAFRAVTRRGSEIGGLLLGSVTGSATLISDFELVECEFARGPLYVLSERDHTVLAAAVQNRGSAVVGYFRSNTRKELALDEEDANVALRRLPSGSLLLVVKPFVTKPSLAALYHWKDGVAGAPASMPFRRSELESPAFASSILAPAEDVVTPAKEPPALRIVSRREEPAPESAPLSAQPGPTPELRAGVLGNRTPPTVALPQPAPDPSVPDPEMAAAVFAPQPFWKKPWVLLAAVAVVLAGGGVYVFSGGSDTPSPAPTSQISSSLGLRVERTAGQLVLTWNREAAAVKMAQRAVLSIWDGKQAEKIELEANQFRGGSIVYAPITSDVSFRLEIFGPSNKERFSEHVRVLGGKPSPMAPPPVEPAKAETDSTAESQSEEEAAEEEAEEEAPAKQVKATKQFQSLISRIKTPSVDLPEPPSIAGRSVELPRAINAPELAPPPPAPVARPSTVERVGGVVQEAKLLKRREPSYPALAKQARVSGAVRLHARILRDGRVTDLKALSGHPLLRQAAIDAVSQWVYSPATLNGEPVDADTTIEVTFNLHGR